MKLIEKLRDIKKRREMSKFISFPFDGGIEECRKRVAAGQKCQCLHFCECRKCNEALIAKGKQTCIADAKDEGCNYLCDKCPEHKSCW